MSKDNQFHQYGYGHYLKAPKKPTGGERGTALGGRSSLMRKMQSPAVATVALVAAAALFAGIIVFTYPEKQQNQAVIPIVDAPVAEVRTSPRDGGGVRISNQNSTVLGRESEAVAGQDAQAIENLLDYQKNKRVSENESRLLKERALAAAMEKSRNARSAVEENFTAVPSTLRNSETEAEVMSREWIESAPILAEGGEVVSPPRMSEFVVVDSDETSVELARAEEKPADVEVLKVPQPPAVSEPVEDVQVSVEKASPKPFLSASAQQQIVRLAKQAKPKAPAKTARVAAVKPAPAASMDFVRDALNATSQTAKAPNVPAQNIEPAAGVASPATGNAYGVYFVQLASITDVSRAPSEWGKIQKKYGVLTNSSYRVENAQVKGRTYYRIQAGPMSRIRANDACDAIKRARNSGGCLVVKK